MSYRSFPRFVFESIEGIGVLLAVMITWPVSKRWLRNWGADPDERERAWPGDALVSPHHETYTRAVSIAAPASVVWKWVVQFGLGRAGFYSYELFERVIGIPVKNVESIEPALQSLQVGDAIQLHPKAPGIPVAFLELGKHVCFGGANESGPAEAAPGPARSWSIYLESRSPGNSRLLLRGCIEPPQRPTVMTRLSLALEGPIDFIMEQRMLRTVRRLAEARPAPAVDPLFS